MRWIANLRGNFDSELFKFPFKGGLNSVENFDSELFKFLLKGGLISVGSFTLVLNVPHFFILGGKVKVQ